MNETHEDPPATRAFWGRHGGTIIALAAMIMLVLLLALNMN